MPHIGHYGITVIINTRAPPSLPPSPAFFLPRIVPAAPHPLPPPLTPHPPPAVASSFSSRFSKDSATMPGAYLSVCLSVCLPVCLSAAAARLAFPPSPSRRCSYPPVLSAVLPVSTVQRYRDPHARKERDIR